MIGGALVLGAGLGSGLLLVVRGVRRQSTPMDDLMRSLDRRAHVGPQQRARVGAGLVRRVEARTPRSLERDLNVVGFTPARLAVEKLTGTIAGVAVPVAAHLALIAGGSGLAPGLLLVAVFAGGVLGFVHPNARLRSLAGRRRRQFEHALSSYLDLVNVVLAGGSGIESALEAAADAGDGWVFEHLRVALVRARATRRSPWVTLGELGSSLGVDSLTELASSVQLAGEQGARIRSSLAAKAASLRARQLTQIEADANAASERMGVPTVLMFLGFLILLGYPALQQIAGPEPAPNPIHSDTKESPPWTP